MNILTRSWRLGRVGLALGTASALAACQPQGLLSVADRELNTQLESMSAELEGLLGVAGAAERRFALIQQISRLLRLAGEREREMTFLTLHVERYPEDPYNAFYLATVADSHYEAGAIPLAVHYYRRVLRNHSDLLVRGESIHFRCLQRLIELDEPRWHAEYYKELIGRFGANVDPAVGFYRLGGAYEALAEWEQAIQTYRSFLSSPRTEIPGEPRAYRRVAELVNFYHSDKSWVVDDLDDLVLGVQRALQRRDIGALNELKAKTNFFAMSWGSEAPVDDVGSVFRIDLFPLVRVRAEQSLHRDSNAREAYLRTTGWSFRITTWYLYFRRIDYKVDPDIDGSWEWAGIYFGEKL